MYLITWCDAELPLICYALLYSVELHMQGFQVCPWLHYQSTAVHTASYNSEWMSVMESYTILTTVQMQEISVVCVASKDMIIPNALNLNQKVSTNCIVLVIILSLNWMWTECTTFALLHKTHRHSAQNLLYTIRTSQCSYNTSTSVLSVESV